MVLAPPCVVGDSGGGLEFFTAANLLHRLGGIRILDHPRPAHGLTPSLFSRTGGRLFDHKIGLPSESKAALSNSVISSSFYWGNLIPV
jgi:hypothetical protein